MRTNEAQAAALGAMLAAATGAQPRITATDTNGICLRIEADLPPDITPTTRSAILTALALADRYGHTSTQDISTVWAELDMEASR